MPLLRLLLTITLFASAFIPFTLKGDESGSAKAIQVDNHWQLFLDDYIIARETGFDRIVHHPRAMGVVIPADKPWETTGIAPSFFMQRPEGTFVAFYTAIWWIPESDSKTQPDRAQQYTAATAYATSRDGIRWEKPSLGLMEAPAGIDWEKSPPLPSPKGVSKQNNLGVPFGIRDMGQFGNVPDPEKRYAISYNGKGYFVREIPDFLHDPNWTNKLVSCGGN